MCPVLKHSLSISQQEQLIKRRIDLRTWLMDCGENRSVKTLGLFLDQPHDFESC
jgi:hypothetical protein